MQSSHYWVKYKRTASFLLEKYHFLISIGLSVLNLVLLITTSNIKWKPHLNTIFCRLLRSIIVSGSSYSKSVQGKSSGKVSALVTPWGGGESKTILFSKSSTVLDHFCFEILYSQRKSMKSTLIYFLDWNKSFQFPPCMFIVLNNNTNYVNLF